MMNAVFPSVKIRSRLSDLGWDSAPSWLDRAEAVRDFANIVRNLVDRSGNAPESEVLLALEHLLAAAEAGVEEAEELRVVRFLGRARDMGRILKRLLEGRADPAEEEIRRMAYTIRDAAEAALARGDLAVCNSGRTDRT